MLQVLYMLESGEAVLPRTGYVERIQRRGTIETAPIIGSCILVPGLAVPISVRQVRTRESGLVEISFSVMQSVVIDRLRSKDRWSNPVGLQAKLFAVILVAIGIVCSIVPGTPGMGFLFFIGIDRLLGTNLSDHIIGLAKKAWRVIVAAFRKRSDLASVA